MVFIARNLSYCFTHTLTLLFPVLIFAQITPLSGIINIYTQVGSVDYLSNTITVEDPNLFSVGDTVLLIQMQGAEIVESNNSSFGNINNIGTTGAYEMAVICAILGNNISFLYQITNDYELQNGGTMQMISIPQYQSVVVTDTLRAQAWDGNTGGVLILKADQKVMLNAPIDLSGQGFRGGQDVITDPSCIPFVSPSAYFYTSNSDRGASKGEGIAIPIVGKETGRGKQANGGGGGNDHNTGGGGGSNYGVGGNGGRRVTSGVCSRGNSPGLGGLSLNNYGYSTINNRIFLGGGGGSGHNNNAQGESGANGGGIIIIITDTLDGNGFGIYANGQDGKNAGSDGAPGGGGGGTILLSANHITGQPLTLQAQGGKGGNSNYIVGINCEGPGGGGGGGVIWSQTDISLQNNIISQVNGGANGISDLNSTQCPGAANGATSGGNGALLTGLNIPIETVTQNSCILNNSYIRLKWEKNTLFPVLLWRTDIQQNSKEFEVQGKNGEGYFQTIATLLSSEQLTYRKELSPSNLERFTTFRIKAIGADGQILYSNVLENHSLLPFSIEFFPNPLGVHQLPNFHIYSPKEIPIGIRLYNQTGSLIRQQKMIVANGKNELKIPDFQRLSKGFYLLSIFHEGEITTKKIIIQ